MASVRSDTNKCVECPAGKTNYAAGETTCTYAFSTAAAPDYLQDGLNLVEAKVNIQALFKLPHADEFSGEDTITCTQTKYRSADGTCTTVAVPLDGAANTPFGRLLDVDFTYTQWTIRQLRPSRRHSSIVRQMRLVCRLWHIAL